MSVLPIYPGTPPPVPVQSTDRISQTAPVKNRTVDHSIFQRELDSHFKPQEGLTFSRHAQKRLEMRGIQFTPEGMKRVEDAVNRASEKGSRDALIVAGGISLVVSVDNRTVVTVMNQDNMNESVVTNIDSAVFA